MGKKGAKEKLQGVANNMNQQNKNNYKDKSPSQFVSIITPLKELSSFITNNDPLSLSLSDNDSQIILINEMTDLSNLKPNSGGVHNSKKAFNNSDNKENENRVFEL